MDALFLILFLLILAHVALTWWRAVQAGHNASSQAVALSAPENFPPASVLVPAWNEVSSLHLTLRELESVVYPQWELILIAGGTDGTFSRAVELAKFFQNCPIQVIEQLPNGKNAALNQGLSRASYNLIVILDGDTLVAADWLTQLIGVLDETTAAACGSYFPLQTTWISSLEQMEKISSYLVHNAVVLQGSGSIVVKRAVLEQMGGFPEDVKVGVDWDLDVRITHLNLPKAFAKNARVRTQRPATLGQYWKNEVRWRRAHLHVLWRQRADIPAFLNGSKYYIIAFAPLGSIVVILASLIVGLIDVAMLFTGLTGLFLFWVLGRRAALVGEVTAYTTDNTWLRLVAVPPALLLTSFVSSWWALATSRRQTIHFKGPRN